MTLERLVRFLPRVEQQTGDLADQAWRDYERDRLNTQSLEEQVQAGIRKAHEATEAQNIWGYWNGGIQYLGSAASIAMGGVVMLNGALIPAIFLVGSGALGLTNRAVADLGGWQALAAWISHSKEQQKKIADNIDTTCTFLTLGMGLCAGFGARAFLEPQGLETVAKTVQSATMALTALTRVGKAKAEQRTALVRTDLEMATTQKSLLTQQQVEGSQKLGEILEPNTNIAHVLKRAIQSQGA